MQHLSGLLATGVRFSQGSPALRVRERVAIGEISAEGGSHADVGWRGNPGLSDAVPLRVSLPLKLTRLIIAIRDSNLQ